MNKLKNIGFGVYQGKFDDVPSRSGTANVTVLLARCGIGSGSLLKNEVETYGNVCTVVYAHHEDTTLYVDTSDNVLASFQEMLLLEESPVWQDGLKSLCGELERAMNEFSNS